MASSSSSRCEVFQLSLSVERPWARDVVRAVLGTILFQRVLGNLKPRSVEVCGITFPAPSDPDIDALLNAKVEAFSRALDEGPKACRIVTTFYPTPSTPPSPPPPKAHPLPSAHPTAMTSALGWFSASTKALVAGVGEDREREGEQEWGRPWEAWVVDVEVVGEGRRGVAEEKLRSQLNDFLLRTIMFVTEKTAHVPPITASDVIPFGFQILVNPSSIPFVIPKAVVQAPTTFPLLHRTLVNPRRDASPAGGDRGEGYPSVYGTR